MEWFANYIEAENQYDPEQPRWSRPLKDHDKAFVTPGRFELIGTV
jgi:hypothetical protein